MRRAHIQTEDNIQKEDFMLTKKDLLGLYDVSAEEITEILDRAEEMKALLNKGRKAESLL